MQVNVPTLVWDELAEATLYYERQSSGLDADLLQEVSDRLDQIAGIPLDRISTSVWKLDTEQAFCLRL